MEKPINLNKVRKERARADGKARAASNAQKFGRTKAQKVLEATEAEKMRKTLDAHKRDDEA